LHGSPKGGVVLHGSAPGDRTMALLSLLKASKLANDVFPGAERKEAGKRIEALTKEVVAGRAVSKAVEATEAVAAATTVTTMAGRR
jgi:hypothetical protein